MTTTISYDAASIKEASGTFTNCKGGKNSFFNDFPVININEEMLEKFSAGTTMLSLTLGDKGK